MAGIFLALVTAAGTWSGSQSPLFDHAYVAWAEVLAHHVRDGRVDYPALTADHAGLDAAVASLGTPAATDVAAWPREQQLAYWINAYNIFTLVAVVDHYPIRAGWPRRGPRNSIRHIDGVWTRLRWRAGGRDLTLDEIEHTILRPAFQEPRIHFAINCASVSCPPLAAEPYRAGTLDRQLDDAARRFLASSQGLVIDGRTLRVSRIFKWYGADFVPRFAARVSAGRSPRERAIIAAIRQWGPDAAAVADDAPVRYLDYDWSLNEVRR